MIFLREVLFFSKNRGRSESSQTLRVKPQESAPEMFFFSIPKIKQVCLLDSNILNLDLNLGLFIFADNISDLVGKLVNKGTSSIGYIF